MDNNKQPQQAPAPVIANIGARNAILWILTADLVAGYQAITDWLAANEGNLWVIRSLNVNPVQLNSQLHNVNATGFGITAVLEEKPLHSLDEICQKLQSISDVIEGH